MTCRKCSGLMVEEYRADFTPEANVWRCINCGYVTDPLMAQNRRLQEQHREPVGKAA